MVSWGPNLVLVCLSNQGFKHSQFYTSAIPKMGMHLKVIGLHPLYSPPFVKVCFTLKHTFTFMGPCISHLVANPLTQYQGYDNEYIDVFMKIFVDNFIIFNDLSTHINKLGECFLKCKECKISLNPKKFAFIVYLELFWDSQFPKKKKHIILKKETPQLKYQYLKHLKRFNCLMKWPNSIALLRILSQLWHWVYALSNGSF